MITPAAKLMLVRAIDQAVQVAADRKGKRANTLSEKSNKELAKIVVDAMASAGARKLQLGPAVARLLERPHK